MARKYNPEELEELKRNVSILHLCAQRGIELKTHGRNDYIGRCPFPGHNDDEPSFIVTPGKNLFHCLGCDAGGSVIDLVMKLDGLTFREALDSIAKRYSLDLASRNEAQRSGNRITSTGLISRGATSTSAQGYGGLKEEKKREELPAVPVERAAQLIERAVALYEKNFNECPEGKQYLEHRGLSDAGLLSKRRIGYCNGRLPEILPGNGNVRKELRSLGLLTATGKEQFTGCVVFPVCDVDDKLVTLYGRYTNDGLKRHVFLSGHHTGLWNVGIIKTCPEIILVESVIDALSVETAGFPNVVAIQGTNGLTDADIESFKAHGVTAATLMLDGDDAGGKAAGKLRPRLESAGLAVTVKALPADTDPNDYLQQHGAGELRKFLDSDAWTPSEINPSPGPVPEQSVMRAAGSTDQAPGNSSNNHPESGLVLTCGLRKYHVLGLEKGPRKLRATIRVEHAGKLHVDTLDFYSARARRLLAQDLCRIFEESPETIDADISRLLQACEKQNPDKLNGKQSCPVEAMSAKDKENANRFGQAVNLIEQILIDYETCGLVGEESNKMLSYLAAVSRKMDEPLSVLVLSSSGAGKTALQDCTLTFVPPEDLVKLTSLSGKALFYKERLALKHKVLALEEGDGAEEATYAIRNLISAGELVIESTIKDLNTGRLTTMENRVEGPTSVFITTTDPETDPETRSRFFVTSIDESREQTRRILGFQRKRQTLEGLAGNMDADTILRRHRNFQRLLKPIAVVNPFADRLTYGDDRLQGRRDQPKYLNLIKAVAFLRQMRKEVQFTKRNGDAVPFVLVDIEDVRIANKLAHEILGHSLDELSRPGRALLLLLDDMVEKAVERLKSATGGSACGGKETSEHAPRRTSVTFSRREIREFTGWAHTRVHRYLKELIDLEYILIDSGRNGMLCRYHLAYEGQGKNGERFMLGLTDPDELDDPSSPEASQDKKHGKDKR